MFHDGLVFVFSPGVTGQEPHHLELVAVGIEPVHALGGAMRRLAGQGTGLEEPGPGVGQIVDRVDLPSEVVQANAALGFG